MKNSAMFSSIRPVVWAFILWYVGMAAWWLSIASAGLSETSANYMYGLVFVCIPLVGGIIGLVRGHRWGGSKSVLGRAIYSLSAGLIAWGIGGLMYSYYNFFLAVEAPYPSVADFAYLSSYPLWAFGMLQLSRAIGGSLSLRNTKGKAGLVLIPVIAVALSYYLLVVVARGGSVDLEGDGLTIFVNFAYPIGACLLGTLALLIFSLSYKFLGGRYRPMVIALFCGFFVDYIAEFFFAYQTTQGTWYVANWVDFLFMTAMTLLTLGIVGLDPETHHES